MPSHRIFVGIFVAAVAVLGLACQSSTANKTHEKFVPREGSAQPQQTSKTVQQPSKPTEGSTPLVIPAGGGAAEPEEPRNQGPSDATRPYGGGIGSNCSAQASCGAPATHCFADYPEGLCTKGCSRTCPDTAGQSKTFCIADASGTGGICVAKCGAEGPCRPGYKCETQARFNEPTVTAEVCVPANEPMASCTSELSRFLGSVGAWAQPAEDAYLCSGSNACQVSEPVSISQVIDGVSFVPVGPLANDGTLQVSCRFGQALYRMSQSLKKLQKQKGLHVTSVRFSKLYACEAAADLRSISPHGLGEAMDIVGFTINGQDYVVNPDYYLPSQKTAEFDEIITRLNGDHVFNNIYTPYCANEFADVIHVNLGTSDTPIRDLVAGSFQVNQGPNCTREIANTCGR